MAFANLVDKGPGETLDYILDFSEWVEAGDTIQAAGSSVVLDGVSVPSGDTDLNIDSVVIGANLMVAWLSGGNQGEKYTLKWTGKDDNNPARIVVRHTRIKVKAK
jgi:hypothetical protein